MITAPTGTSLTINLTNNLVFGANKIPTSIVIVGLIGGWFLVRHRVSAAAQDTAVPATPATDPPVVA